MNLAPLEQLIRTRIGLDVACLGAAVLARAAATRMAVCGLSSPQAYTGLVSQNSDEWSALVGELVVPESWFFRGGRELFDHLARWVRGRLHESPGRTVRVLCVPCSTGEEPYSLAIALQREGVSAARCRIDAADLARKHLLRAASGRYSSFSFREAGPDPRPDHFLDRGEGQWEIAPELRDRVHFHTGNLVDSTFLIDEEVYDLILCRNLFIYLTEDGRTRALTNLERLLAADGWLVLTPAEADRLPRGRFIPEGPISLAIFKREDNPPPRKNRPATLRRGIQRSNHSASYNHIPLPALAETRLPDDPLERGRRLADAGELEAARTICEQALAAGVASAGLFHLLGVIHLAEGRSADAGEAFRKALYLAPDHVETLTHMAILCEARGETDQAAGMRRRLERLAKGAAP